MKVTLVKVSKSLNKIKASSQTASFPYLVLAVSLLLTFGITYNFYQSAKNKDKIRFNNEINRLQSAIENKVNLYIALLKGGRGFIESNQNITRQNFAEYVESLEMRKNYTGAQGIGYTQIVPAAGRNAFIEKIKAEGYADFNIFPFSEKADYQVVTYLEPFDERNRKFIGFDISTEKNWLEASNRAAVSGKAAASAKISLMQEDGAEAQPGFLIYLPIYKKGTASSVENREKNISGYIFSPFRADRFFRRLLHRARRQGQPRDPRRWARRALGDRRRLHQDLRLLPAPAFGSGGNARPARRIRPQPDRDGYKLSACQNGAADSR